MCSPRSLQRLVIAWWMLETLSKITRYGQSQRDRGLNESLIKPLAIISLCASIDPSHHHIVLRSVRSISRHETGVIVRQTGRQQADRQAALCPLYLSAWNAPRNHKQAAACRCLAMHIGNARCAFHFLWSVIIIQSQSSKKPKRRRKKKSAMELRWQRLYGKTHKPLRERVYYMTGNHLNARVCK